MAISFMESPEITGDFFVKKGGKKGAIFNEFVNINQIYFNQ